MLLPACILGIYSKSTVERIGAKAKALEHKPSPEYFFSFLNFGSPYNEPCLFLGGSDASWQVRYCSRRGLWKKLV